MSYHIELQGFSRIPPGRHAPSRPRRKSRNALMLNRLKGPCSTKTPSLASRAKVAGQAYVMADIASISLKTGHAINHFSGKGKNPGLGGALQATSAVGMAAGVANILSYHQVHATAKKVGYVWGQQEAKLKMARGAAEVVSSANVTAGALFDCLTYDGFVAASKSSFVAMRGLSHFATAAGGVRYATLFAYSGNNMRRAYNFGCELEKIEAAYPRDEKKRALATLEMMKGLIEIKEEEYLGLLDSAPDSAEKLTDEEIATISPADMDFVNRRHLDKKKGVSVLKEIARVKMGREKDLSDKTSVTLIQMLRKEIKTDHSLASRLEEEDPTALEELRKIIGEAKSTSKSHVMMNILVMVMCGVAIGATVLATIYTAGLFHFVIMGLSLAVSAGWLAMDAQMVKDAFKSDEKGKYDDILRWVVNTMVFAVGTLSVFYTAGTPILILGITTALLMVSVNLGIWYKNTHVKHIRENELSVRHRVAYEVATGSAIR